MAKIVAKESKLLLVFAFLSFLHHCRLLSSVKETRFIIKNYARRQVRRLAYLQIVRYALNERVYINIYHTNNYLYESLRDG